MRPIAKAVWDTPAARLESTGKPQSTPPAFHVSDKELLKANRLHKSSPYDQVRQGDVVFMRPPQGRPLRDSISHGGRRARTDHRPVPREQSTTRFRAQSKLGFEPTDQRHEYLPRLVGHGPYPFHSPRDCSIAQRLSCSSHVGKRHRDPPRRLIPRR